MEKGKVANCFYFVTMESSDKIKYHILSSNKKSQRFAFIAKLRRKSFEFDDLMLVLLSKKYY